MPSRRCSAWAGAALLLAACTSVPAPGDAATATTPASGAPPTGSARVQALRIDEPAWRSDGGNWTVVLTWQGPPEVAIDHYEVQRNGVTVGRDIEGATFNDAEVEPGARYRYAVVGVDVDGTETAAAIASIRTDEPKLADARLEGSFVVRMVAERASGTKDPVRGGAILFSFDPTCRSGPCPVRWAVRRARTEGTLRKDDGVYAASLRTPLFIRNCFGRVVDEALDVHVHVTRAAPLQGQWRATKIEGSIDEVSSYGGCVTASIDWTVHGSLQT